jgi:hypothetical protein
MVKSQNDRVLEALRKGPVSPAMFLPPVCDGGTPVLRLAARVGVLRDRGCVIETFAQEDSTALYRLVAEPDSETPNEGAAAMTTVEARGTSRPEGIAAVSGTQPVSARAAGAQLTGQVGRDETDGARAPLTARQDGLSQGPATSEVLRVAHGHPQLFGGYGV